MQENLTVQLCDFHSSESFNNHSLCKMLQTKLREPNEIAFSLKWEPIYEISKIDIQANNNSYMTLYDVEVVPDRDLIIFGNTDLYIFNLTTRTRKRTIKLNVTSIHEIVVDQDYLYMTTGDRLMKYNLNSLLDENIDPELALVWQSTPSTLLSNCWGLALYRMNSTKYAFVLDYGCGIFVFDTQTGQQVQMKVPNIKTGYGITFTDEHELIISTSDKSTGPLQIYKFNTESQSWELSREAVRTENYNTLYGIWYERKTKLIYLVDTYGKTIYVFNKETMEIVNEWKLAKEWELNNMFGIALNPKKGHLYITMANHSIQVFK